MNKQQFEDMKKAHPHLTFEYTTTTFQFVEKTWCKEFGIYRVFKRDNYRKSNGKMCYLETYLGEEKIMRENLRIPPSNSFWQPDIKKEARLNLIEKYKSMFLTTQHHEQTAFTTTFKDG